MKGMKRREVKPDVFFYFFIGQENDRVVSECNSAIGQIEAFANH